MTESYLKLRYWLVNAKSAIRQVLHRCLKCFRLSAEQMKWEQSMGDLPKVRITAAKPFLSTGVDFAGPVYIRPSKGRGITKLKAYIAVFVCMVTKAVHLELVSDLTSEAFIAAFKRFTARRRHCKEIFSDNATNFQGNSKILDREMQAAINNSTRKLAQLVAYDKTTWNFIPVATPHFGGI